MNGLNEALSGFSAHPSQRCVRPAFVSASSLSHSGDTRYEHTISGLDILEDTTTS